MARPKKENVFYKNGIGLFNEADYNGALQFFDQAIERNSRFFKAWIFKGLALAALNRYDESISCYDNAIEIRSYNSWSWQNKGWSLVKLGKFDEAIVVLSKAIEIAPRNSNAWSIKGDCLLGMGRTEEAKDYYNSAIEINPKNEFHWNGKGSALIKLGKFEEAMDCFNKAIELSDENPDIWYNKGLCLYKQGKYDATIPCFSKAIELNPGDLEALYYKGSALMSLGNLDDANACFNEIRTSDPQLLESLSENNQNIRLPEPNGRNTINEHKNNIETSGKAREPVTDKSCVSHEEIQWILLILGCKMGLDVWVASNDRNKELNGNQFSNIPKLVEKLPIQFDSQTNKTIELIDVIWLRGNSIVAAFEIENTTMIYSGLLRMSDLISMQPNLNINLYIVAPDERRKKVISEINRPTFLKTTPPVCQICRYIPFSKLKKQIQQYHDVIHHLRPSFLKEISESCESQDVSYEANSEDFTEPNTILR
jgi:tetratricopeptide (TPR) repeat protein